MFYNAKLIILLTNFLLISSQVAFLSIGDWGGASLGGYHYKNALDTSMCMLSFQEKYNALKILLGKIYCKKNIALPTVVKIILNPDTNKYEQIYEEQIPEQLLYDLILIFLLVLYLQHFF